MFFIDDFKEGDVVQGVYLCKSKTSGKSKNGNEYESVVLIDKTGSIDAKIWEPNSPGIKEFEPNDYVMVKGHVNVYNKAFQLKIDTARKADPGEYVEADYVPTSRFDTSVMMEELRGIIKSVKNKASPIITLLGGADCVPRAVLRKCRTIIILVKDVIITTIDGAMEITVITRSI